MTLAEPNEKDAGAFDRFLAERRFRAGSLDDLRFKFQRYLTLTGRRWVTKLDQKLALHGQTHARWMTLFWIQQSPEPPTQKQLAVQVGVEGPTLVRSLNALEETGMVRRTEGKDRRVRTLELTKKAEAVLNDVTQSGDALRAYVLQDIEAEELRTCISVFKRVHRRLYEIDPDPGGRSSP